MALLINCSVGNVNLFPEVTFIQAKRRHLTKYSTSFKHVKRVLHTRGYGLPQSSLQFYQIYRISFYHRYGSGSQTITAIGTDVAVEDPDPTVSGEVNGEAEGTSTSSVEISETAATTPVTTSTVRSKRPKPVRKSEMPLVKDEELIPGASFVGKVRSTQPFGAFVDIGAFTDGLVHVSRISDAYVKDVAAAVSIGQEVKVKIVEINKETGRISLTMRDSDDASKTQQRKEPPANGSSDKPRSAVKNSARSNQKRDEGQKSTKLVKGQVLDGTVKNLARSGAFVSLPDGEEGFLPVSEESEGFGNILGNSSLHTGKQVKVRVLRITRGQVTLTMKKEEDVEAINRQLNRGVVHVATNPFELAFRQNKDIAAFLNERETMQKKASLVDEEKVKELSIVSDEATISVPSSSGLGLEDKKTTSEVLLDECSSLESISDDQVSSYPSQDAISILDTSIKENNSTISYSSQDAVSVLDNSIKENNSTSPTDTYSIVSDEVSESVSESDSEKGSTSDEVKGNEVPDITFSQDVESSKALTIEENKSSVTNDIPAALKESDVPDITVSEDGEISINSSANENVLEPGITEAVFSEKANGEVLATEVAYVEAASSLSNGIIINGAMEDKAPPIIEKEATSSNSSNIEAPETLIGQSGNHDQGNTVKATISPALVKELREESGAGMMDCKKALTETDGDIVKAQEFLRKKGLASADKKASRATAEGRIGSYIHDSRIGVLIEVNCETDFVSRGEIFHQLVDDLAMQVAACPQVSYLVMEDIPEEIANKERKIESQKEDLLAKPEQMRAKIVDGRINKRLSEFALLEQPYIKNDKMAVKDWVKQIIATVGENIQVKRFIRYNLGEGLEKKIQDFAAEVAAQTTTKPPSAPKDQPAETKEAVDKPATSTISAALVKQLREETGAGMMDCKKALTETGGNLEKARDYLRKKGLSSADKKSSRLAAEGRISSYIHDSRIGCLIEVNSETDFVARNEKFIELVDDLAMQVVACPQVQFVSVEEIPESIVNKEKEIEMQREDLQLKPEQIREKIVEGRISKRLGELALLEQPFIKDESVLVKDLVKQTVAALGENIKVRRFVRYSLGEAQD